MSELIITRGLPGSGKTTWAERWVLESPADRRRVNRDSLRRMIHIDAQATARETEATITRISADLVRTFLDSGLDVVVDDTNLRQRAARAWATLAATSGAELKVQDFTDVPLEICMARNAARNSDTRVPDGVIETMYAKYIAAGELPHPAADVATPGAWRAWEPTIGLQSVYLVDIDGTVAIKGDRDIYDGSKAHLDTELGRRPHHPRPTENPSHHLHDRPGCRAPPRHRGMAKRKRAHCARATHPRTGRQAQRLHCQARAFQRAHPGQVQRRRGL